MAKPKNNPYECLPQIDLVATQVPDGMVAHTEYGITKNLAEAEAIAVSLKTDGIINSYEFKAASEVGLEWRTVDGQKLPQSAKWSEGAFILLSNLTGDERVGKHGQVLTRAGQSQERINADFRDLTLTSKVNSKEWLDHLEKCHKIWECIKNGDTDFMT
ncbi:hypothetical protein [Hellea balneolensis]|uniref:hypothetical protein n=1 Tax=Hellea balneolensis TaxID=287478 RepID=UPI00047891E8|nr:hypothetical protein [Hellea balneolensis]